MVLVKIPRHLNHPNTTNHSYHKKKSSNVEDNKKDTSFKLHPVYICH